VAAPDERRPASDARDPGGEFGARPGPEHNLRGPLALQRHLQREPPSPNSSPQRAERRLGEMMVEALKAKPPRGRGAARKLGLSKNPTFPCFAARGIDKNLAHRASKGTT
jgi:hypothetical protein